MMVKLEDCWIGDVLWIKSRGINGTFLGIRNGKARMRIGHKVMLILPRNLAPAKIDVEDDVEELDDIDEIKNISTPKRKLQTEIDLHLEKLLDYTPNQWNSALDFQIAKCRKFLEEAIEHRIASVVIIHGKGAGILKEQVKHLLGDFKDVFQVFPINKGGAIEVWFNYRGN